MGKTEKQKSKILFLKDILERETDENHGITMDEIIHQLEMNGITAERRSIYDDIRNLSEYEYGMNIQKPSGKDKTYRLLDHDFTIQEVKLLVDSVQASKFLSEKKSRDLIAKLEKLCSKYDAMNLRREMLVANRVKQTNERIFTNIDSIQKAIAQDVQISFKYFEYGLDGNNKPYYKYRSGGKPYFVSPCTMAYTDDNYYLLAYYAKHNEIRNYRIDRMTDLTICTDERQGRELFEEIDKNQYTKYTFAMFNGEKQKVTLRFAPKLLNVMIDRFGTSIMAYHAEGGDFQATVTVSVSPQFFGWLAGLGELVHIETPDEVATEFRKYLKGIVALYK